MTSKIDVANTAAEAAQHAAWDLDAAWEAEDEARAAALAALADANAASAATFDRTIKALDSANAIFRNARKSSETARDIYEAACDVAWAAAAKKA